MAHTPKMARFNDTPKTIQQNRATPFSDTSRARSVKTAWKSITNELSTHQATGITIEPTRRAKIADRLKRDHHLAERRRGETRQIVKGRRG